MSAPDNLNDGPYVAFADQPWNKLICRASISHDNHVRVFKIKGMIPGSAVEYLPRKAVDTAYVVVAFGNICDPDGSNENATMLDMEFPGIVIEKFNPPETLFGRPLRQLTLLVYLDMLPAIILVHNPSYIGEYFGLRCIDRGPVCAGRKRI